MENNDLFPEGTREMNKKKANLAPDIIDSWRNFSRSVFQEGALPAKTKQLIAVAAAHITQCPYCIRGHVAQAKKAGVTEEEMMEAIWIAAEMRAGAAYAHANIAMDEMEKQKSKK